MADRYIECRSALPRSYVDFIESHDGWEGDLGAELGYVVIWNRETIQERWDAYKMAECMNEHWFPFGSNGGDEMLCFDLSLGQDRVFMLPYIGMSNEAPLPRFHSFANVAAAILKTA